MPLGSFVFSRDAALTEIVAAAGYDFAVADLEHAALDLRDVEGHLRAARAGGIAALVRVAAGSDAMLIARLLDLGADGIVLPHFGLDAAASARQLAALRYAPAGTRPTCTGVRANGWGLQAFGETARRANEDVLAVALIEDMEAVADLDALLARARPDALMPGPADLATALGVPGQFGHPDVQQAVQRSIDAARRAGVRVGVYLTAPHEQARWAAQRPDFFVYSIDLKIAAQALAQAAQLLRAGVAG